MPRKALVDPNEMTEKAMMLYWVNGYTGTSVDDLAKGTGASKSMIYNLNGKKGVFIEAFMNYMMNYSNPYLVAMQKDDRGLECFIEQYEHFIDALLARSLPKACMFVNTAVELGKQDEDINELYYMYIKRVHDTYTMVMERSYKLGEFKDFSKIPYYVDMHINMLFSMASLYKVRSRAELLRFVHAQLALIK